ncbi:peroxiredoxin [Thioalkalivibrio sp. ALE23]|uniref:peroxiredoxin family protein n=1 Tax=Thioalkalivibrio sp. ALE23 TaxID=1265495 RepID=UPI00037D7522|nr:TlpA disulfide reductase family protein [Thioalkalivibrio sp. ALE23]
MSKLKLDRKAAIGGVFIILVLIAVGAAWITTGDGVREAPGFAATNLEGEAVSLDDYDGRPVLISFWATDCPECIREIPTLNELHADFRDRGFDIVAIAMEHDRESRVRSMSEDREIAYTVIHDEAGDLASTWGGVRLTPTTFLVSPRGRIVYQKLGEPDFDQIRDHLERWLS